MEMPRAARYTVLRVGGRGDGEAGGADGLQAARAPRVIGKAQRRSRPTTRSRYMDGPRVLGSCPMDADRRRKFPEAWQARGWPAADPGEGILRVRVGAPRTAPLGGPSGSLRWRLRPYEGPRGPVSSSSPPPGRGTTAD